MATASDNFCNDKKVMNLNHHWSMEVFPSYMSTLTLGAEKVSACVEASAFLVVLVCRRFNWCRRLLYILLFFNFCNCLCNLGFLRCFCSFCCVLGSVWFSLSLATDASIPTVEGCPLPPYFHRLGSFTSLFQVITLQTRVLGYLNQMSF